MRFFRLLSIFSFLIFSLSSTATQVFADGKEPVTLGGYVGVVSNYIWRGAALGGPAVQGSMELSFSALPGLAAGTWLSSAATDSGSGAGTETDYFLSYSGGEDLSWSLGWNGYSYDFTGFSEGVGVENEYFATLGSGDWGASLFLVPDQKSTEGTNAGDGGSYHWLELTYAQSFVGLDLSALVGNGNYSTRGDAAQEAESAGILVLGLSKRIDPKTSVTFHRQMVLTNTSDNQLKNQFWFGIDFQY